MKTMKRILLIIGLFFLEFSMARSVRVRGSRRTSQVYSVSSKVDWTIFAPNPYLFSTTELFYLQKSASSYFGEKIKNAPEFKDQNVILVDFKLRDQAVGIGKAQTVLTAELSMTYTDKVLNDFSDILTSVVSDSDSEDLLRTFVQNGFFDESSSTSSIKYAFIGNSSMIADDSMDKYTIIFISMLTMSSVLVLAAIAVFTSSKCSKSNLSNEIIQTQTDLQITKTQESEEPVSPTGVLGAHVKSNGHTLITPTRGIHHNYEDTPMSQDSNVTSVKSIYSTTSSKAPLGILSMKNLKSMIVSPERQKNTVALYDLAISEDESDYDIHNP